MNRFVNNAFVFFALFCVSNAKAFTIDMENTEAINSLGYFNVDNMKIGEFGYLESRGFSVCKKDGELMINGFAILQKKRGEGRGYYKLYKGEKGIDINMSAPSLGYATYHIAATRIASAKQCDFTFEHNKFPLIRINTIFGTDNLSSLIKKKDDEKRKDAHK